MTLKDIHDWFVSNFDGKTQTDEATKLLYTLMLEDKLSIAKLVELKENAMKERYNNLKEDASDVCAVALMYKEKIYENKDSKGKPTNGTKEDLDRRAINIFRKLGFFKL